MGSKLETSSLCFMSSVLQGQQGRDVITSDDPYSDVSTKVTPVSRPEAASWSVLILGAYAVTAALLLLLAWYAVQYILNMYAKGRVYPALGIPVYVSYLWVPIGLFVTGVQYALTFLKNLQEREIYLSTDLRESESQEMELEL